MPSTKLFNTVQSSFGVLIFDDFEEPILRAAREVFPDFNELDLAFDSKGHGDFALKLFRYRSSKEFDRISEKLKTRISSISSVKSVTLDGAYLNVAIKPEMLVASMHQSVSEKGQFPDTFQDPERVLVEHTSTNPTGPIHIGRSRNSIIGDSLARLLRRYGFRVSTQYYVNDTGKQVVGLYLGYLESEDKKMTVDSLLAGYRKTYAEIEKNPEKEQEIESLIKAYESQDPKVVKEVREICMVMLHGITESLGRIGIKIDDYVWESGFLHSEEMESVLADLKEHIKTEDGATFVEVSPGKKAYLTRKAHGTSLYVLRDLAYHTFKSKNYDWLIDVLGEDHKDYTKQLNPILVDMLHLRSAISYVFYGFISLETGKMSTRSGNMVSLDDLIAKAEDASLDVVRTKRPDLGKDALKRISKAVAKSSIRFQIAKINPDKPLVFRFSEALNFEGDSAPYIMYSYARATKILQKGGDTSLPESDDYNDVEHTLVRQLYTYPYVLRSARESLRVDVVCSYLLDLVRTFNDFYNKCQVIGSGDQEKKRIKIVEIYRHLLSDACSIVGIELLEEM